MPKTAGRVCSQGHHRHARYRLLVRIDGRTRAVRTRAFASRKCAVARVADAVHAAAARGRVRRVELQEQVAPASDDAMLPVAPAGADAPENPPPPRSERSPDAAWTTLEAWDCDVVDRIYRQRRLALVEPPALPEPRPARRVFDTNGASHLAHKNGHGRAAPDTEHAPPPPAPLPPTAPPHAARVDETPAQQPSTRPMSEPPTPSANALLPLVVGAAVHANAIDESAPPPTSTERPAHSHSSARRRLKPRRQRWLVVGAAVALAIAWFGLVYWMTDGEMAMLWTRPTTTRADAADLSWMRARGGAAAAPAQSPNAPPPKSDVARPADPPRRRPPVLGGP